MAAIFDVNIVTPERIAYEGRAISLIVPAELGYLGVLANHAPLVANLTRGTITVRDSSGNTRTFGCPGRGFLEVARNTATLLLDSIDIPAPDANKGN